MTMTSMSHSLTGLALVAAATLSGAQFAGAAPAPKLGTVYTRANGASTTNSVYTTIVSITLPGGRYHVSGKGSVHNQQATDDTVSCNLYADGTVFVDASTATAPSGTYAALAFEGVATLPTAGGPIWVECISSNDPGPFTSARLVVALVPEIVNIP
jgi:hypothetical protein